jgi:hypothetical protein
VKKSRAPGPGEATVRPQPGRDHARPPAWHRSRFHPRPGRARYVPPRPPKTGQSGVVQGRDGAPRLLTWLFRAQVRPMIALDPTHLPAGDLRMRSSIWSAPRSCPMRYVHRFVNVLSRTMSSTSTVG